MTKYGRRKAEKVLDRIGAEAKLQLKIATDLYAKYMAAGDEENTRDWSSIHNGMLSMLQALDMINTNELILLIEYFTETGARLAEEIKRDAA